jgi:hypothetical protein
LNHAQAMTQWTVSPAAIAACLLLDLMIAILL